MKFYSTSYVAKAAGVTRQTLYNWIEWGAIRLEHQLDGHHIFSEEERDAVILYAAHRHNIFEEFRVRK